MSVKVDGLNKLLSELDRRLGPAKMQHISDNALKAGAKVFVEELKRQLETFRDTGATVDELTVSEPFTESGVRTIKVYWKGPKERFRIIHLNEWGTVINPNPRGKGKIAAALRNSEKAYRDAIKKAIKAGI